MVHTVLWIEQKIKIKKQKTLKPLFSAVIWLWLFSNESHIGVFGVLNKVLIQKFIGDVENTIFVQVFKVSCTCFQNPLFLMLAFPFVGFVVLCFIFLLVFVWQIKLLCSGFCFFFFGGGVPGFGYVLCVGFFGVCFWFCFFGGSGEVAQRATSSGPKLSLFVLFCFGLFFCLFCFSCWVLFVLLFLLLFIFWKGLRVKWGGPYLFFGGFGLFLVCFCLCWNEPYLVFPRKRFFSSFAFCLTSLFTFSPPPLSFLPFFLSFFLSFFLTFVCLFLSFLLYFFLSFSLSPFSFRLSFLLSLLSCSLAFFLSLPLFLFFCSLLFSCLCFWALLFLSFCFPCLLEQC